MNDPAISFRFLLLGSLAMGGCGSLAGTDYKGERLATMHGSVVIENPDAPKDLVPALAFRKDADSKTGSGIEIVDVKVTGEFPAGFTIDVFEPPPQDAILPIDGPDEPWIAIAYITAVKRDHPRFMAYNLGSSSDGTDCSAGTSCTREITTCRDTDETDCFAAYYTCDSKGEDCRLDSTEGNPGISPFRDFAGFSKNYFLMYFRDDVPAGARISKEGNGGRAISAGYHLIKVTPETPTNRDEVKACKDAVLRDAWAEYNRQHGTAYQSASDVSAEELESVRAEVDTLRSGLDYLKVCDPYYLHATLSIVDTWSDSLEIEISTGISSFQF